MLSKRANEVWNRHQKEEDWIRADCTVIVGCEAVQIHGWEMRSKLWKHWSRAWRDQN